MSPKPIYVYPDPPWLVRARVHLRRIGHHLFNGALIIAPFAVTIAALRWLFVAIDGILQPIVNIPGLGFAIIVMLVGLIGWLSSFFFVERMFVIFDRWLERTPGVQYIYTTVRDFCESFAGNKPCFQHTVLVNVHAPEVWLVGFLTDENVAKFELGEPYVAVYVPQAYNVGGQLYFVRRERIREISRVPPSAALKYAVTGGAADISAALLADPKSPHASPEKPRAA